MVTFSLFSLAHNIDKCEVLEQLLSLYTENNSELTTDAVISVASVVCSKEHYTCHRYHYFVFTVQ